MLKSRMHFKASVSRETQGGREEHCVRQKELLTQTQWTSLSPLSHQEAPKYHVLKQFCHRNSGFKGKGEDMVMKVKSHLPRCIYF